MAKKARQASAILANCKTEQKNKALLKIADSLEENSERILAANRLDIDAAKENGIKESMIDRLRLDESKIKAIAEAVRNLSKLADPVGKADGWIRPNGLEIRRERVPLGVIGIIYESRPNVTADAATLCLKSGNACILKGGKEALNSNMAIVDAIKTAISECGMPAECVSFINSPDRKYTSELMSLHGLVDVIIPRGSARLINAVTAESRVPVIETGAGNCHLYVDKDADLDMALNILINAKVQRPSVCNAIENLLVHAEIADEFLPMAFEKLAENKVEVRGCEKTLARLKGKDVKPADDEDFYTEYNDYIISVKVVDDLDTAICHINEHGTRHSEAIVTRNIEASRKFTRSIDAAVVYTNASTRFTDGEEFGFGAEIGISTGKLHARGPMGLDELTTVKYFVSGEGNIR